MKDNEAIRLYIAGHSGIGKSPLTKLFDVEGWEPFRVRKPRNEQDAKVCITPERAHQLEEEHKDIKPLYESPTDNKNQLRVYEDWSVFDVRGKKQWLNHTEAAKDPKKSLRVEIFAPAFIEMIENQEKLRNAFALNVENIIIVLLNPTSESFRGMKEPSQALCLATLAATMERRRIHAGGVDLTDSLQCVEHLSGELIAWRRFYDVAPNSVVECKNWSHFEFRYSVPDTTLLNAKDELIRASYSLLTAIEKQAPKLLERVEGIMREPSKIMDLEEVL